MLSKVLAKGFSNQVNMELESAYTYLELSIRADNMKLTGTAHWMRVQAFEEMTHAGKFMQFLRYCDLEIALENVVVPKLTARTAKDLFNVSYKQEKAVTASIKALADQAMKDGSYAALSFLQEFLKEQMEEERSVKQVIERLELAGRELLLLVDAELGQRKCQCAEYCFCQS